MSDFHRKTNSTGILDLKSINHKGLSQTLSNESTNSRIHNHTVKQFRRISAANIGSQSQNTSTPRSSRNKLQLKLSNSNASTYSNVSRRPSGFPSYPTPIPENLPYPIVQQPFLTPVHNKPDDSKGCNLSESIQIGSKIFQLIGTF